MKNKVWIILLLMILLSSVFMGCMLPPAHTHSYSEWTVVKEATCTEAGLQEQVCSCGDKVSAPILATGHTVGEWVVDSELSCTTDWVKKQLCTVCGEIVNTESTQATGHIFTDWSTVTESTCTQNGQQQRACTVCGEIETKDIELLEHSFGEWTIVEQSTCTQQGLEERACVCGEKETRDIPLAKHIYGEWVVVKEATCTEVGLEIRSCECGVAETKVIAATDHTEGEWITDIEPTCTQDGSKHQVCAVCGSTIKTESIDALGHNYTSVVTPPTCEEQGYTTHTCSVCSDSYIDTYVAATDHTEGEWITDIEPTCTQAGGKHLECATCRETIATETIEPIGHNYEDRVCSACGELEPSIGLLFTLSGDSTSYVVSGIGSCTDLDIVIPSTHEGKPVTEIGLGAFDFCYNITSVVIPKGVTIISMAAFKDCFELVSVVIPDSVISIGTWAFINCQKLENISIPEGVTRIGDSAFGSCKSLKSISIPASVTSIGEAPFNICWSLANIAVDSNNSNYKSVDGNLFSKDGTKLIQYAAAKTNTSFVVPGSVTSIENSAFSCANNLTSITIQEGVTIIGYGAFDSCLNLVEIDIPSSVTCIDTYAFSSCYSLEKISLSEGLTTIGDYAFQSTFELVQITLPSTVVSIGESAFALSSIEKILFAGTEEQWNNVSIANFNDELLNATIVFNHPDHNYIAVVTPPTCTEQGYTTHTCHCGDSFVDTYVDALGHTISSWDIVDESVSVEDRLFAGTCEICHSVEEISLQQRFAQLEYVSFGDSITYGIDGVDWGLMEDPYPELVSNALGFKLFSNLAVSGATFCQNTLNRTNMTQKILSFTGKADIISLMLGVNDCYVGLPLGTSESRDNTTIYGSLFLISEYLTNNYSDSFVFYMTPFPAKSCYEDNSAGYNLEDVANAIKHVAALYDIPVLDMFLYSEYENVEMNNPNGDGLHPSQSFMRDYAAPKIISFIKDNYGVNYIHSHTIEVDQEIDPTCTNTGLTEGKHCDVCGEVLIAQEVVDALGHDEVKHNAQAPTCTEIGWNSYVTCSRCDYTTYNEISAMGHYHELLVVHPTCAVQGYTYHECHCGDSYIDSITDPAGHKFIKGICNVCGEWDSFGLILTLSEDKTSYIVSAIGTCTEIDLVIPAWHDGKQVTGIDSHALQNYEKLRSVIIPSAITYIGENAFKDCTSLERVIFQSATEIKSIGRGAFKGCISLTKVSYPRTQENWNKITIDLENSCLTNSTFLFKHSIHSYEPVVTAPTCTNQGYTTYTCTCGLCYVDIYVDALGHDEVEQEAQAPTCTEIGWDAYVTCSHCDFTTKQIIPAIGHSYKSVVTDPTCIEQGYTTHTCICGDSFMDTYVDATGHDEISHDAQTATCTEIGWNEYVTCSNCDYTTYVEVPATDHDCKSIVTSPSCSSRGYTTYTCVNCGYAYKGTYVDALDHNFENDICTVCGAEIGSEGLAFSLSEDGAYYIVSGIGTCIDTNIKIPSTYNGRSVRGIAAYAF
ncbi:MAG: leucine-rich repeat protein, partial [Clostridia bacterium]|nr:leucine-rich repeat protein [Clostridia bacterium]